MSEQTVILKNEMKTGVSRVVGEVLPFAMPSSRIGILRGVLHSWQKYWEIVGTNRDYERTEAYRRLLSAEASVHRARVECEREMGRLENIEQIVEDDERIRRIENAAHLADAKARLNEAEARSAEAAYERKVWEARAEAIVLSQKRFHANAGLLDGSFANSAKRRAEESLVVGRDYALALEELEKIANLPADVKDCMREHLKCVYDQALREIAGGSKSAV